MAGLFDYTKPGKGVDPDAPRKKAFFRFFELYWRKFSRMLLLNLLVFLFVLPIMMYIFFQFDAAFLEGADPEEMAGILLILPLPVFILSVIGKFPSAVIIFLLALSGVFYGPAMCGLSYTLRKFYLEEHAFSSDFFAKMKENFLQGMIFGLMELGAFWLLFFNVSLRPGEDAGGGTASMLSFIQVASFILIFLLLIMRNYFYTMIVTFRLKFFKILKNALIFAFVGFFRNIGVIILQAALLAPLFLVPLYDLLFLPFFYFSATAFAAMFACYPLIHKHMIKPAQNDGDQGGGHEEYKDPVERVDPRLLGG